METAAAEGSAQSAVITKPSLLDQAVAETASRMMPLLSIEQSVFRTKEIAKLKDLVLEEGIDKDYGTIPGTNKPTLLKPGAEKICTHFGYVPRYKILACIEDWNGSKFGGEPLFYYHVECTLERESVAVGSAMASCNSWEKKYRWRSGERACPHCGVAAIIKGKEEYGGGWLCFQKKGGCGAKFNEKDVAITGQSVGQIKNPDFADSINPVLKIACKRAYVSATLSATGASQYFVPDMEDMHDPGEAEIRRQAGRVDTGGAPVGTQQAADAVAKRKVDEANAKKSGQQKQQPASAPATQQPQLVSDDPFSRGDWKGMMAFFGQEKQRVGDDAYYSAMRPLMPPDSPIEKLQANHLCDLAKMRAFRDALAAIRVVPFVSEAVPVSADSITQEAIA